MENENEVMKELIDIQAELSVPKTQFNKFGNYNYRSCEDILQAVKPLLHKHKCTLTISDDIIAIGNSQFIKAIATLKNSSGQIEISSAFAKHPDKQAGMNDSQITGSASSYARKYALNGLFGIDDTKDADHFNTHGKAPQDKNPPQRQPNNNDSFSDRLKSEFNLDPEKVMITLCEMQPKVQQFKNIDKLPGTTKAWISANLDKFKGCEL